MDDRLKDYLLGVAATLCVAVGLVMVLVGYLGVRDESELVLQIPYVVSGGLGGLAFIGLGALAMIRAQMLAQARRFDTLVDELDQWKEAAIAEVREFLADAEIEAVIEQPAPATTVRRRRVAQN